MQLSEVKVKYMHVLIISGACVHVAEAALLCSKVKYMYVLMVPVCIWLKLPCCADHMEAEIKMKQRRIDLITSNSRKATTAQPRGADQNST